MAREVHTPLTFRQTRRVDAVAKPHHHTAIASPADVDTALDRVREVGGRVTAAKRAVVELIYHHPDGVTAEELVAQLDGVDLTTVYRTLSQLEQAGVVEHVHLGHGPASYRRLGEATVTVICDGCGKVTLVPVADFADAAAAIEARYGVALDLHHFAVSGHCTAGSCSPP
jgi:Fe2+ or Zn2+ uptake regulation protein